MHGTGRYLAAFVVMLGLALAACGGGGGAPPTVSMPQTPTPQTPTPQTPRALTAAELNRVARAGSERTLQGAMSVAGNLPRFGSVTQSTNAASGIATDRARVDFDVASQRLSVTVARQGKASLVLDSSDAFRDSGPDLDDVGTRLWDVGSATGSAVTYAFVGASWFTHDPSTPARLRGEWTVEGYWLHLAGRNLLSTAPTVTVAEMGAFVDGSRYRSPPARLPTRITARYDGNASGFFVQRYGTDSGAGRGRPQGTVVGGDWRGLAALVADFSDNSISGCIGCTDNVRITEWLFPSGVQPRPAGTAVSTRVGLGRTGINADGTFRGATVTLSVSNPGIPRTSSSGSWGGKFSSILGLVDGVPHTAAGTFGGRAGWSDGSTAAYVGTFRTVRQ